MMIHGCAASRAPERGHLRHGDALAGDHSSGIWSRP
jgi:hypothetical protein